MKIEKVHEATLRVVYNDYTTSYSGLLDMSNRTPLFLARLKGLLVEVFKCIRGLNPEFMNTVFVMDNKHYDIRRDHLYLKTVLKPSNMVFNHLPIKELNFGIFYPQISKKSKI